MTTWVDVVARVRGLEGRLLRDDQWPEVAGARDLATMAQRLADLRGTTRPDGPPDPRALELAERRRAGAQVRLVGRWCGDRTRWLAPLFEEEDCRSIRAAVRGALGRLPPDARLAGLLPTPALPERALAQLVACADPSAIGALLAAWSHPFAAAVQAAARQQQPDLFTFETDLARHWAGRAHQAARGAGRPMRTYVERVIDAANGWTALLLAGGRTDTPAAGLFLPGGRLVRQDAFLRAAGSADRAAAAAVLGPLVRQTPLAALGSSSGDEWRIRRALWREQRDFARRDPVGPAVIIAWWLRLRGEVEQVQRAAWAIVAGAPHTMRVSHDAA